MSGGDRDSAASARDLVRKRTRRVASPDTGRMHHIGGAPAVVPVHTDDGVTTARATAWQLADRTRAQLEVQQRDTEREMQAAAARLDFEAAARLRDEVAAVAAELSRRHGPGD